MSEPETTTDAGADGAPVSPGAHGLSDSATDASAELLSALRLAAKHLERSDDLRCEPAVYRPGGSGLRHAAEVMEARDADIDHIRAILRKYAR